MNPLSLEKLVNANLIDSRNTQLSSQTENPWYMRIFLAVSGWLSALFGLSFVMLTLLSISDSEVWYMVIGLGLFISAPVLTRRDDSEYISHLMIALAFAGQALFIFGLIEMAGMDEKYNWLVFLGFNLISVFAIANYEHRFLTGLLISIALGGCFKAFGISSFYSSALFLLAGLLWLNELSLASKFKHVRALGYGLILGLIQIKTSAILAGQRVFEGEVDIHVIPWLDEGLNIFVFAVLFSLLLRKYIMISSPFKPTTLRLFVLMGITFAALSYFAHGLSLALFFIAIAIAASNRTLFVFGILGGLINLSSFYYFVDYTLLEKSGILLLVGVCCGFLAFAFSRHIKSLHQPQEHKDTEEKHYA